MKGSSVGSSIGVWKDSISTRNDDLVQRANTCGWICMKCGRSYGPGMITCYPCNAKINSQGEGSAESRAIDSNYSAEHPWNDVQQPERKK